MVILLVLVFWCIKLFTVPSAFPKDVKCKCNSEEGTSLEISWMRVSDAEARGKLLYVNVHYQNVNEFKPNEG